MKIFADSENFSFLPSGKMITLKNRSVQGAVLLGTLIFLTISLYSLGQGRAAGESALDHYKEHFSKSLGTKSKEKEAKRLYAEELLQRPLATDLTSIPKLFHQSWINSTLPAKFEEWSHSCRQANPDWEWVLWTDEDNMKLVEKYAPWFASTYEALHSEIYRADTARNIYMHVFGGVYADLDTECVGPYEEMFAEYNTSMIAHNMPPSQSESLDKSGQRKSLQPTKALEEPRPKSTATGLEIPASAEGERKVFLGRMGTDDNFVHSIPNAWMGSTPGHPFWVLPLESCEQSIGSDAQPEYLTGPPALYDRVRDYRDEYEQGRGDKMDDHYNKSGWRHLYPPSRDQEKLPPQSLVVLPFWEVYPYSWERDGEAYRSLCWVTQDTFSASTCKQVMGLDHWGSHSITYWSHSWSTDGHWGEHMDALNKPTETSGGDENDDGDTQAKPEG
ncbi:MAG: hypothetical protein Q9161_001068 [Pseudevernia consocians]